MFFEQREKVKNRPDLILKFWLPVVFWMAAIFVLSSIPGKEIPKIEIPHIDKFIHFSEFFILGLLLIRAFLNTDPKRSLPRLIVLSIIIAFLYAAVDEWHQYFVSDRTPELFDILFDYIGSSAGIFVYNKRG